MSMEYFAQRGAQLRSYLDSFLAEMADDYAFIRPWGRDVCERLGAFAKNGKLIRGGLVALGCELAGGPAAQDAASTSGVLALGAAMELLQSAFLIHDDIMDRDSLRRGQPSFFWQYRERAAQAANSDAYHYGESMGICGGDVAFFLAFRLMSLPGIPVAVAGYCAKEVSAVGLAQMQDVHFGSFPEIPSQEDILTLYTWKTGRYSFSLPLALGAMLAGAGPELVASLEKIGEAMGAAFQMRDDELGLFGEEAELGKPIGSDMREGKKTLLLSLAWARLNDSAKGRISSILGKQESGAAELAELRSLVESCGARVELGKMMADFSARAREEIQSLSCHQGPQAVLSSLLEFIVSRRK